MRFSKEKCGSSASSRLRCSVQENYYNPTLHTEAWSTQSLGWKLETAKFELKLTITLRESVRHSHLTLTLDWSLPLVERKNRNGRRCFLPNSETEMKTKVAMAALNWVVNARNGPLSLYLEFKFSISYQQTFVDIRQEASEGMLRSDLLCHFLLDVNAGLVTSRGHVMRNVFQSLIGWQASRPPARSCNGGTLIRQIFSRITISILDFSAHFRGTYECIPRKAIDIWAQPDTYACNSFPLFGFNIFQCY
jgi:hypothetical protein